MPDIKRFQQNQPILDFLSGAALQLIPGLTLEDKFGYADTLAATGDIWAGNSPYVFPVSAGQAIEAMSASGSDTGTLTIEGIDAATGLSRTENVTLDGTTEVSVPGLWKAVNRAFIGDGTLAIGAITIQGTGDPNSNVFALIPVADQQTVQCPAMVSGDKIAAITALEASLNKSGGADASLIVRLTIELAGKVARTKRRFGLQRSGTSSRDVKFNVPILAGPLSKIRVLGDPSVSLDASADYSMVLIDKTLIPPALLATLE